MCCNKQFKKMTKEWFPDVQVRRNKSFLAHTIQNPAFASHRRNMFTKMPGFALVWGHIEFWERYISMH